MASDPETDAPKTPPLIEYPTVYAFKVMGKLEHGFKEYVRQLFAAGCIQSGFFHRFTCTVHSPVGKHPEQYGVTLQPPLNPTFASNDISFTDLTGINHDVFGAALKKALYNYMHGIGLELDVREWFEPSTPVRRASKGANGRRRVIHTVPRTTVPPNLIERALA